ncbi:MAG: Nif3-like dinuclear metal center hexameric protein [Mycoplasmatales bacterium]
MKLKEITEYLEFLYPLSLQEEWDNCGLLIGNENANIKKIMTCLDLTNEVLDEAIKNKVNLIIAHHPIIFTPLYSVLDNNLVEAKVKKLIKHNINFYAAHTNVDIAPNGLNDWLSEIYKLKNISVLKPTTEAKYYNLNIEVIQKDLYPIIDILKKFGVGQNNNTINKVNITPKVKYEENIKQVDKNTDILTIEGKILEEYLKPLKEELSNFNKKNRKHYELDYSISSYKHDIGLGRYGTIKHTNLENLLKQTKKIFKLDYLEYVGPKDKIIKKVAICGGSGADCIKDAINNNCDVLITGDIKHHEALDAKESNLAIINVPHTIEIVFSDVIKDLLLLSFDDLEIISSDINTEPFEVI